MNNVKPSIFLYFASSIIVLLSVIFKWEELEFYVKPMVVPSILFYYLQYRFRRVNNWLIISLVACFVGDMILLINDNIPIYYALVCFFICYVILIFYGIKDRIPQQFSWISLFQIIIGIGALVYVLYSIIDLIEPNGIISYGMFLIYGLSLLLLTEIALYNFFSEASKQALYFSIMALSVVISDVFYAFYHFIEPIEMFHYINVFFQLATYYCIVSYFLVRNDRPSKFSRVEE